MSTKVIFTANNGTLGTELWVTDGTAPGTFMLADIFPGAGTSYPSSFFDLGNGTMLFSASDGVRGRELWITDGTSAGTTLLKDIRTLPQANGSAGGSYPGSFFALDSSRTLFRASDGSNGSELWITDGTSAGTTMLADINPGTFVSSGVTLGNSSSPGYFNGLAGGRALFTATQAATGNELWVTDGTAAGTTQLIDINPGSASASPSDFFRLGPSTFLFSAVGPGQGRELWITDGTAAGTTLLKDTSPGAAGGISQGGTFFTSLGNGKTLFRAYSGTQGNEPWVTDGTAVGTYMLADIRPGSGGGFPNNFTAIGNGKALFSANDGVNGAELWITDGTSAGTSMLANIAPGSSGSSPAQFTAVGNGQFLFRATGASTAGTELWITDGTAGGTSQLADLFPGTFVSYGRPYGNSSNPTFFGKLADGRILMAANNAQGRELWLTDGTVAGTGLLKDLNPWATQTFGTSSAPGNSNPANFVPMGDGRFIFTASDGLSGTEPWVTDGTVAGTMRLADINQFTGNSVTVSPAAQRGFTVLGDGRVAFRANDGLTGNELWVTDFTAAGTTLVADIFVGPAPSTPYGIRAMPGNLIGFDANVGGSTGRVGWISDGTPGGTVRSTDFLGPNGPREVGNITDLGTGKSLVGGFSADVGSELWVTDGTAAGTSLLLDIAPGASSGAPSSFFALGAGTGRAVFTATTGATGRELWSSDGTAAGTSMIADIRPGAASGATGVYGFRRLDNGKALFMANDGVHGTELWVTDGTAAGTGMVRDVNVGAGSVGFSTNYIAALPGGRAVFRGNDGVSGEELWITDGTSAGTTLLKELNPGFVGTYARSGSPRHFASLGDGRVAFFADDGVVGSELWVTDGTTAGTTLVRDIVPGASYPSVYGAVGLENGRAVFGMNDRTGTTGTELWVTDGTTAGTSLLKDIRPGSAGSSIANLTFIGNGRAMFDANDGVTGTEVWVTDGTAAGTFRIADINKISSSSSPGSMAVFQTNDPPVLTTPIADQSVNEDAGLSFTLPANTFTDPNPWDGTLAYTATLTGGGAMPAWLSFDATSRSFTGTPLNADVGTVSVTVTASDRFGKSVSDSFDLTVVNTNDDPVAAGYATSVVEDATGSNLWNALLGLATDDDLIHGDALTIAGVDTSGTQGHVIFDAVSHTIRYVADAPAFDLLANGQSVVDSFTYTVRDLAGATSTATVSVTVTGIADSTVSFGVRSVSDPSLGGSIDGAEGASNAAQNQITANELISAVPQKFKQLLAFVDSEGGGNLGGVAGADRAYNLSDVTSASGRLNLPAANTALDPVRITAHGVTSLKAVGDLTDRTHFVDDKFGVDGIVPGELLARWLNLGDSMTFSLTGYDGVANPLLRSASFTVDTVFCSADVLLDWDGATVEDQNGSSAFGGFAIESEALVLSDLANGAHVEIDFYARTLTVDGVAQDAGSWFAAREAAGGLGSLTVGASLGDLGWAPTNLRLGTTEGVPGAGFINPMF